MPNNNKNKKKGDKTESNNNKKNDSGKSLSTQTTTVPSPAATSSSPPPTQYIYFPLNSDKTGQTLTFTVKKNPYKLLHTSLDALIRHLQRNQQSFKFYAIVPLELIPIAKNRFNLEGEVSAILPFKFTVKTVKPLRYDLHHPVISPMHRQNRLVPSYIYGL